MENNSVILHGVVKREAVPVEVSDGYFVLDFSVSVWCESANRWDIFDCRTTNETEAYDQCQGYLSEGDKVTVEGRLEKKTSTTDGRIGGKTITLKSTDIIVFVDDFIDFEEVEDDEH